MRADRLLEGVGRPFQWDSTVRLHVDFQRPSIRYETDFIAATKLDFVALLILSTFP